MKMKLLPKFIISLGVLALILTVAISLFSYRNSKTYLEDMYAQHVTVSSRAIASMIPVEDVKAILAEGGENTEAYERTYQLLNKLKKDGEITYLSLTVPDEDSVTFYIDAMVEEMGDDPANQLPYGSDILYTDAAYDDNDMLKYELVWSQFAKNEGLLAPVVTDNSYGYNYTGVAAILDEDGTAIAEIQYILDMGEVRGYLNSFLYTMILIAFIIVTVCSLLYIVFVRNVVTAPIGKLAAFTKNITDTGVFENQHIEMETGDEIEDLSTSFNFMLRELESYIDNLSKITAEKERISVELNLATDIQANMLPCIFPPFPGQDEFDLYATMDPAKEVGGDFYDFFMTDEKHVAVIVADVSGKGVPAALFMVIAKTLIKDHALMGLTPSEVFTRVNKLLCESNDAGLFVTAWMGILDIDTGKLTYVNAGHNPPLIKLADGGFEYLKARPGFVLAGMDGVRYRQAELTMAPGDRLFLYTDGVTEATSTEKKLYGEDRLYSYINAHSKDGLSEMLRGLRADIDSFVGEAEQFDDITMLILDYLKNGNN